MADTDLVTEVLNKAGFAAVNTELLRMPVIMANVAELQANTGAHTTVFLDNSFWKTDSTTGHTASEHDGFMNVVDASGRLWVRDLPNDVATLSMFGADPAAADNSAALTAAQNYAAANDIALDGEGKSYPLSSPYVYQMPTDATKTVSIKNFTYQYTATTNGDIAVTYQGPDLEAAIALTSDATRGDSQITVANVATLSAGDWVILISDAEGTYVGGECNQAEHVRIADDWNGANPVTLDMDIEGSYAMADNARVRRQPPAATLNIDDVSVTGPGEQHVGVNGILFKSIICCNPKFGTIQGFQDRTLFTQICILNYFEIEKVRDAKRVGLGYGPIDNGGFRNRYKIGVAEDIGTPYDNGVHDTGLEKIPSRYPYYERYTGIRITRALAGVHAGCFYPTFEGASASVAAPLSTSDDVIVFSGHNPTITGAFEVVGPAREGRHGLTLNMSGSRDNPDEAWEINLGTVITGARDYSVVLTPRGTATAPIHIYADKIVGYGNDGMRMVSTNADTYLHIGQHIERIIHAGASGNTSRAAHFIAQGGRLTVNIGMAHYRGQSQVLHCDGSVYAAANGAEPGVFVNIHSGHIEAVAVGGSAIASVDSRVRLGPDVRLTGTVSQQANNVSRLDATTVV